MALVVPAVVSRHMWSLRILLLFFVPTVVGFQYSHPQISRPITALHATSSTPPPSNGNAAIVVGAGPAGLATALCLACKHDYKKVTVLESSASPDKIASYDSSRAYLYNINGRGQVLTNQFPAIQQAIEEIGVGILKFERLDIPADPKEIFTNVAISRPQSEEQKRKFGKFYWVPRHELIRILLQEVDKYSDVIDVCFGLQCQHVTPMGGVVQVSAKSVVADDTIISFEGNLVIGADGIRSKVREALATQPRLFEGWNKYKASKFMAKQYKTASVGLRIKTLQVQPQFEIPVGDGTTRPFNGTSNYNVQSINTGRTNQISLVLLPMKNATAIRSCAICTLPNHDLWKMKTGAEMKAFFVKAFPRFSFDGTQGALVAPEEWERFAQSKGSTFPPVQYSPGAATSDNSDDDCGIALVGDSLHAFPPDLGQGVNAALGDVAVLSECLKKSSVVSALQEYDEIRAPEAAALAKLARCGAPYQYRQASLRYTMERHLWTANIIFRVLLNKVTHGLTPQPSVMQMMDSSVSFKSIARRSDRLTLALWSLIVAVVSVVIRKVLSLA